MLIKKIPFNLIFDVAKERKIILGVPHSRYVDYTRIRQ